MNKPFIHGAAHDAADDVIDLVIPNVAEFNLRHPRLALDPATVNSFVAVGRAMSEQSVFWSSAPRVHVLPAGVDSEWYEDVHRALGVPTAPVISPVPHTGRITADLLRDPAAMESLRLRLRGHHRVRLVTWGAAESLYRLAAVLRTDGHDVLLDCPAEEHYWASLYLDSKTSCLDLATRIPGMRVAPVITTDTFEELRGALGLLLAEGKGAVVRSPYGVSGEGSAVVDPEPGSMDRFWHTVRDDPLLRVFPLQVQEYVSHPGSFGNPAVDLFIADDGVADIVPSVMTVDGNRFVSVNVGAHVLPADLTEDMYALTQRIANAARHLGFRGWFGIDFVADPAGDLYVTEFNARRTGGTQWIPLLDQLHPAREVVAHARHAVPVPESAPAPLSYTDMRPVFTELWRHGASAYPIAIRGLTAKRRSYGILTNAATAAQAEGHADALQHSLESRFGMAG
ncbi:hypothetical protein [Streptomyces sp. BK205]|uniref:hypothetical protein n=1 Tax=Streptomyces sp. BK205 TaxID=2512164 RepID=UPI00105366E1|nr:hypothetical protein [Streptomyces sp. BK205]TCR16047.1 hypothetical protein EV578_115159 [Streptomyces sp. BK205]